MSKKTSKLNLSKSELLELEQTIKNLFGDDPSESLDKLILAPTPKKITEIHSGTPNSYAFWGEESAKLVNTPESFYVPIDFDTFKLSASGYDIDKLMKNENFSGLVSAATQIFAWTQKQNIDEFFLKNATFSGKHRWPFTCNIDMSYIPKNDICAKLGMIAMHMTNINDYASLVMAEPGLGFLARKKLETDPVFYAFGSKFYKITDKKTGISQMLEFSGQQKYQDEINSLMGSNPDIKCETYHIGMPITKELRIISIDGKVTGFVPYWPSIAFEDQIVYDKDGNSLDDIKKKEHLQRLNKFEPTDLDYLKLETQKIADHEKFNKYNWAIDWLQTKDGKWYMIDMQLADNSYMDFKNMIYPNKESEEIVLNFIYNQWQKFEKILAGTSKQHIAFFKIFNNVINLNVEKKLKGLGYPTIEEIKLLHKKYNGK